MSEKIDLNRILLHRWKNTLLPELLEILGEEKFLKTIAIMGGLKFSFPTIADLNKAKQELEIISLAESGLSFSEIAERLKLSETWVKKVYYKSTKK